MGAFILQHSELCGPSHQFVSLLPSLSNEVKVRSYPLNLSSYSKQKCYMRHTYKTSLSRCVITFFLFSGAMIIRLISRPINVSRRGTLCCGFFSLTH